MLWIIIAIIVSYLIGSIPTAYLFVKILKNQDIRKLGSGNVGATNAARVLGKKLGVAVLLLDALKGVIPVIFLAGLVLKNDVVVPGSLLRMILGLACICGHNWTVFLGFKGGKGVATTIGVLIGLAIKVTGFTQVLVIVLLVWLVSFIFSRIISLASILAGISFPVAMLLLKFPQSLLTFSALISLLIIWRHRSNIQRILGGTEPRFTKR